MARTGHDFRWHLSVVVGVSGVRDFFCPFLHGRVLLEIPFAANSQQTTDTTCAAEQSHRLQRSSRLNVPVRLQRSSRLNVYRICNSHMHLRVACRSLHVAHCLTLTHRHNIHKTVMKLSAAVVLLLAIGTVEAHTSTRRAHRRAQEVAASDLHVAMVLDPDSELNADGGQHPGGVLENEEINYYDPIGGQTPFDIGDSLAGDHRSESCQEEEVGGLVHIIGPTTSSFGGIAFVYNSISESVSFRGAAGSSFDFDSCMEYAKRESDAGCGGVDRMLRDRTSNCRGMDTILFCPMKEGQCATFELTETVSYCSDSISSPAGIKFYVTNPGGYQINAAVPIGGCHGKDIFAVLQCGPTRDRGFGQTSQCIRGDNNNPFGAERAFDLDDCAIRPPNRTVVETSPPSKLPSSFPSLNPSAMPTVTPECSSNDNFPTAEYSFYDFGPYTADVAIPNGTNLTAEFWGGTNLRVVEAAESNTFHCRLLY